MKKNLRYDTVNDTIYMLPGGLMGFRVQYVIFHKHVKDGEDIEHHARIITYVDVKKGKAKLISLFTNDLDMEVEYIVAIYRKRWEIELLFYDKYFIMGSQKSACLIIRALHFYFT